MKRQSDRNMVVGFAWFDRAQWHLLAEVADDRNELDDTFDQWERSALNALRMLKRQGLRREKVYVDVNAFVSWCKDKRLPLIARRVHSTYRSCYNIAMGKPRSNRAIDSDARQALLALAGARHRGR